MSLVYKRSHFHRIMKSLITKWVTPLISTSILALLLAATPLQAQTLEEAARQAARQYNARVISARTERKGEHRVHVIKLVTKDGMVKTVRIQVREPNKGQYG